MAIDVKALLTYTLLDMSVRHPLERITATQIIKETGMSRRTFYSHFQDKNDLICYIYHRKVLAPSIEEAGNQCVLESVIFFERLLQNKSFMMSACRIEGQNCLCEYMHETHRAYMKEYLSGDASSQDDDTGFFAAYHGYALTQMCIDWILSGMQSPPETIASDLQRARISR